LPIKRRQSFTKLYFYFLKKENSKKTVVFKKEDKKINFSKFKLLKKRIFLLPKNFLFWKEKN
jgi:hypothetical protein